MSGETVGETILDTIPRGWSGFFRLWSTLITIHTYPMASDSSLTRPMGVRMGVNDPVDSHHHPRDHQSEESYDAVGLSLGLLSHREIGLTIK